MASFFSRYTNGEYEQIWAELILLGNIYEHPLYEDALAVAQETMRRVKDNIETLILRLLEKDYEFLDNNVYYRSAGKQQQLDLDKIETLNKFPCRKQRGILSGLNSHKDTSQAMGNLTLRD